MSIELRLKRLEALRAIDDLITDLARAFDSGPSADLLRPLFTDNAKFVIDQYDTLIGADVISKGVAGNAESGFRWTLHYLVSPRVVLTEDACAGDVEFYLWEVATSAKGKAYWIGGRYLAQVINSAEKWRFSRLELKAELISHYPDGWQTKPETLADA